jgi:hypothetical protein
MDDLDRLYQHLVASLHADAPHLLRQRFTVGDLAQQLVPYRLHRRALGFDSIQQYDLAMLRLVAGERGYLTSEPVVQDAARQGLASGQPDVEALRRFSDAPAALAPEPLRSVVGETSPPTTAAPATAAPAAAPVPSSPVSEAPSAPQTAGGQFTPLSIAITPIPPEAPLAAAPPAATLPAPSTQSAAPVRAPEPAPTSPPPEPQPAMPFPTRASTPVVGGKCQYCGQPLPEGRPVTFCPYCGQNVTIVRCPACSTELEAGWKFCVTCGRAMDGAPAG